MLEGKKKDAEGCSICAVSASEDEGIRIAGYSWVLGSLVSCAIVLRIHARVVISVVCSPGVAFSRCCVLLSICK